MNVDIVLIVILGLLGVGTVLVLFGTVAKNRWGVNFDPVSCPRCSTPLPRLRDPQNIRQAMWGGGTCAECGTEVDKWGREVNRQRRGHLFAGVKPEGQMLRAIKRRLVVYPAAGYFCLTLLLAWLEGRDHPSTLREWLTLASVAAAEAAIFSVLFYAASIYLLNRLLLKARRPSAVQEPKRE